MTSIQERLQMKRAPIDQWSIREKLCLAVARSTDQNWGSVSRALKPFGEPNRPADWFSQKNCAAQYGALLANVETPKRKKRTSGNEMVNETPAESIVRKLLQDRQAELKRLLTEEKTEYQRLQEDMVLLQSGEVSEEQLDKWCKEIDDEEQRKEQEVHAHNQWLKEREIRKQKIEQAFRPVKPTPPPPPPVVTPKRKYSGAENGPDENREEANTTPELPKPALSPLLTSLLQSPSQVPANVATSSILHTAITNQRPTNTDANPTIASLLNSSTGVTVSPGLQQLVSSAIGQEPTDLKLELPPEDLSDNQPMIQPNDILDDENIANLKIDDIANSILVQDGPLPEIKNEVDVIISDLIQNADDIVADPEQHLQIDGNGELELNLDLEDFEESDPELVNEVQKLEDGKDEDKLPLSSTKADPFEFHEDPIVFEPLNKEPAKQMLNTDPEENKPEEIPVEDNKINPQPNVQEEEKKSGSVEIVEVVVMEENESQKELDKAQIEEMVQAIKQEDKEEIKEIQAVPEPPQPETQNEPPEEVKPILTPPKEPEEIKQEPEASIDVPQTEESTTITPNFSEELYDDINMEVKIDKSGKAKRDYSRTKKKEEKDFDVLLTLDKVGVEDNEIEENFSDRDDESEKKDFKPKVKSENERSNSPWTEEEEVASLRSKRRYSTPTDSVPNSPASGVNFDDDKDYKNWKKAVMLVYSRLATNKYASLFTKPITDDQAPGYHTVVYRPMDLQTIRKNIESGAIRTTQEFQRDVLLMLNNAIMYNKTNDTVYNMARQMQQECLQQIQIFVQAQAELDAPVRRETRTSEPANKRKRTTDEGIRSKKRKED